MPTTALPCPSCSLGFWRKIPSTKWYCSGTVTSALLPCLRSQLPTSTDKNIISFTQCPLAARIFCVVQISSKHFASIINIKLPQVTSQ
ncbi:unnamed protein product [Musa acuminata subsp. burmannicoides]